MDEEFKQLIMETFSEVFETMYFTFLEPIDELPSADAFFCDDSYIRADISYNGPQTGNFSMYIPRMLAFNITTNFLGVDDDDVQEEQVVDTAKETANMAIGSLLGKIDPGGECKLQIPQSEVIAELAVEELLNEDNVMLFNTDFGHLWVVYKD